MTQGVSWTVSPWCCGPLQTGSIAVAFASSVSLVLASLWAVQELLDLHHFFIALLVGILVAFGLMITDVCLFYGAHKRQSAFVWPWLVSHSLAVAGLALALGLAFEELGPMSLVAVAALGGLLYCLTVVAAFYRELRMTETARTKPEGPVEAETGRTTPLEDTFSQLPARTPAAQRLGPTRTVAVTSTPAFRTHFLPQPDEVIPVTGTAAEQHPLLAATPSPSQTRPRRDDESAGKTAAWPDIDPSFTPFKRANDEVDRPKMRIFLPVASSEDSSSSEDEATDSDRDSPHEPKTVPGHV